MGRFKKKFIWIILLIGIFLLTGCSKLRFNTFNASKEDTGKEVTLAPEEEQSTVKAKKTNSDSDTADNKTDDTVSIDVTTAEDSNSSPDNTSNNNMTSAANIELQVYTVNAETAEIETVTALIPEGSSITAELIVETTIESLADQSIIIETDRVITEDDKIIVSFVNDKAPYTNLGSGFEGAVLDAIAYSLIENLKDYSKVIYRIEGKAYVSGAYEYSIDEPYLED